MIIDYTLYTHSYIMILKWSQRMDDSSNQNNLRPLQADKCFVNFNIIIYSLHVSFLGYTKQIFTLQILVSEWTLSKLYYYVLYTHTLMSTTRPLLILYSLCGWWYVSSLFKEQINYDTGICYDNVHTAVYSWLIVYSRYRSTTCSDRWVLWTGEVSYLWVHA